MNNNTVESSVRFRPSPPSSKHGGFSQQCSNNVTADTPRARRTDPDTSHAAAASVRNLRKSQESVLKVLRWVGPCTQEQLVERYVDVQVGPYAYDPQSPSGIRTRLKELVRLGKARDTGRRVKLASGRNAIVWEAIV